MRRLRRAVATCSVVLLLLPLGSTIAVAHQVTRLEAPSSPPPGYLFSTEAEEQERYELQWKELFEQGRNGPVQVRRQGDVAIQAAEGYVRVTGLYFYQGSGLIEQSSKSEHALSVLRSFVLKILGSYWKTVGVVISNIAFIYSLIPSDPDPATAKSYVSYSYYLRNGEYYKNGSWWVGVRTERRKTEALAWMAFYDVNGVAHALWYNGGVGEFVRNDDACHLFDDAWILGWTRHAYQAHRVVMQERYWECVPYEP